MNYKIALIKGDGIGPEVVGEAVKVMDAISREKCTAFHGVPTMYIAMLDHPDFPKYDFSSLRTGIMAGSPCPVKVMQAVVERMNMKEITITYGQTEASPGCTMSSFDDPLDVQPGAAGEYRGPLHAPCGNQDCGPGNRPYPGAGRGGGVLLQGVQYHDGLLQNGGGHPAGY